jgi:hypothetical protein
VEGVEGVDHILRRDALERDRHAAVAASFRG